ncbi:unnamed protein product [Rotaria sordida]|uniref:receptor protein-tyrosine kinase n=1 Tax=Rotaria sordida TaxID=392033 RepID=A0A814EPL6_9BILA|nr:unnamed protein product [Rotaria sordida]CAF3601802.1 unnamed protein product [Rotaria sordida]
MKSNTIFSLFIFIIKLIIIKSYTFDSSIDNLLYVTNTSTLYAISSSHLHQLHWSTINETLLLLHRRVQLHSSLDNTENGVSVFLYEQSQNLLIICSRSLIGRCILYDANDISRIYILDSTIETNYLGCLSGCYTFLSSTIIRSALIGNRHDRNGNVINSQIELRKDLFHYNINYQFQSSDHTLITSLTFLNEKLSNIEYIYGFDYQQYTYYILKSSRLARLCQASIVMRMTYEEIPLVNCQHNSSFITGAFHSFENFDYLYIIYENTICIYTMNEIIRAFQASKIQCQMGIGYRLAYIIDSDETRPMCEKTIEQNLTEINECTWQPYLTNTYMDGIVGAIGEKFYQTMETNVTIRFIFAQDNIVIIGTSQRHVLKFIRHNQTILYFLHESIYHNEPFNSQYVVDNEHESLIFAIDTELHRYAYNSCSLYDTCQSCVGSRRYDDKPCIWFDGKCSLSSNSLINDWGCPPSIDQIQPMNANINQEQITLTITGSFEGIQAHLIKVLVQFSLPNQNEFFCTIQTIENNNLTCNLIIPKQAVEGIISVNIRPKRILSIGDTDISGLIEYPDKFHVYIPKPILIPNYGPAVGGTKIRIQNLNLNLNSTIKIFLGNAECHISKYDYPINEIECINQACMHDREQLELNIQVNNHSWQLEKTYFQCRANPIILNWYPKKSIISGGIKLIVSGQNLNVVQKPMMKFIYNTSILEFISSCESISTSEMICISPIIDRNLNLMPSFDLNILFIMDNMKIIPNDDILIIVNDPIYYSFVNSIQEINSTNIIRFEGSNLIATHSIDQIDIRIDKISNACIPFNFTDTQLLCLLSKFTIKNIKNSQANVEIHVGTNLIFSIGKILFQNRSSTSVIPYISLQFGSWTILILLIIFSITILIILFTLVILTRRRFYQASEQFQKEIKPPQHFQTIWCELGKTRQINRKNLNIYEKIGQGCFGDVYRGELKQYRNKSIEVAIKVLRDHNISSMREFLFEANRMKDFSHPNILSLIGISWDPTHKAMVLLPYMKNGDLRSYLINEKNRPTIRQLITWTIQIADGMEYLASLKFVHRDLATRNCMLDEQLICRISDFGLSRDVIDRDYYIVPTTTKDNNGKTLQITPRRLPIRWLSPESIESSKYTIQSDVWSFGVLLWELMSRGRTPYSGIDNADIYTYIKHGYRLQQPTYCPQLLYKSVMIVCWHADPSQRPSFTQLAHDIRHVLHQLELEQQRKQSLSVDDDDDDDTTIIQRYPIDRKIKHLSSTSLSSMSSIGGQYITTPHRQSENVQLLIDRQEDNEDAYTITINESADVFSTTRLLPEYTETSIVEDT